MPNRRSELTQQPALRQQLLPLLYNFLRILEMPNLELDLHLREALEENPVLEEVEAEPEELAPDVEETKPERLADSAAESLDDSALLDAFRDPNIVTGGAVESELDKFESIPAQDERLYDQLMHQANAVFSDRDAEIAELVISNIEKDGYLSIAPEELAGPEYPLEDVQRVIARIRMFDPVGCAWRDLRDCLLAQLAKRGFAPDAVEARIVQEHLKRIRENRLHDIAVALGVADARVQEAVRVIAKLNPRPCDSDRADASYVTPDFVIRWEDRKLVAELREEHMVHVRIKREYLEILKNPKGVPAETLEFVRAKRRAAEALIIAVEQRRRTLLRVVGDLLDYQREFFEKGNASFLRPLTMVEFAAMLNVSPSTISRAVSNKYLDTPWGIYRMKYFFNTPVAKVGKQQIHETIKQIVGAEDKTNPLSDAQIAIKLSRHSISISRRTVMKYREQLGIPSHQQRKCQT